MADKPSKALVLYSDGLARFLDPSNTHLHTLASKASCGFLSLPNASPSESEEERVVREFAVLLDACQANEIGQNTGVECQENSLIPTLSERFMGMKAALITNNLRLKAFGGKIGFTTMQLNDLSGTSGTLTAVPFSVVASELLKLLGFEEGKLVEASRFDLVVVHIGAGEKMNGEEHKAVAHDMEHINALVGGILQIAQPGTEVGSRLHLSVVMSYGHVVDADESNLSIVNSKNKEKPNLSMLFPRQSYTMKGENPRSDVRHHCPMLISQWQYAVTRKDMVETFSFKDFKEHGGNLVIPADRFLYEVAFKLWKAPKYGA